LVKVVEISDYAWAMHKAGWALFGVKEEKHLIRELEEDIILHAKEVIEDSEKHLLDDKAPEALFRREIGILKEEAEKKKRTQKIIEDYC
jgi:hypothetical protein